MAVSIKGFNNKIATFNTSGTVKKGNPVKMASNLTVTAATDSQAFMGMAASVEGELCGVQLTGYAVFEYSGTAPTVGIGQLAADGTGKVKTDTTNGRSFIIVDVDTTAKTVGIIL